MNIEFWLVAGVAAFDLLILASFYLYLRSRSIADVRRALLPTSIGLLGFVFHAFMFLSGAFLILQLATIAGVIGLCFVRLLMSGTQRNPPDPSPSSSPHVPVFPSVTEG
jgi:uncharacterized membrane protein